MIRKMRAELSVDPLPFKYIRADLLPRLKEIDPKMAAGLLGKWVEGFHNLVKKLCKATPGGTETE
jgi:hypothetical protein